VIKRRWEWFWFALVLVLSCPVVLSQVITSEELQSNLCVQDDRKSRSYLAAGEMKRPTCSGNPELK